MAHALEDCFVAAQKGKLVLEAEPVDVLLQGVDMLIQVAQLGEPEVEAWQSGHAAEIDSLVAKLTMITEGQCPPQDGPKPSAMSPSGPETAFAPPTALGESQGEVSAVARDPTSETALPRAVVLPSPPVVVGQNQGQGGPWRSRPAPTVTENATESFG